MFSRAVPKKSATAKPIVSKSSSSVASKKPSHISDHDSDSDFGDFSLPKLTAKAKQVKTVTNLIKFLDTLNCDRINKDCFYLKPNLAHKKLTFSSERI